MNSFSCLATPAFLAILFYMRTSFFAPKFSSCFRCLPPRPTFPPERKLYDENGDRIFENLQSRLQRARANERIPVLIEYRDNTPLAGTLAVRFSNVIHSGDQNIRTITCPRLQPV